MRHAPSSARTPFSGRSRRRSCCGSTPFASATRSIRRADFRGGRCPPRRHLVQAEVRHAASSARFSSAIPITGSSGARACTGRRCSRVTATPWSSRTSAEDTGRAASSSPTAMAPTMASRHSIGSSPSRGPTERSAPGDARRLVNCSSCSRARDIRRMPR